MDTPEVAAKTISKKRTFTVYRVGAPTEKKNVTLTIVMKEGLVKQFLYLLCDEEDAAQFAEGENITDFIPKEFKVRESVMNTTQPDGSVNTSVIKWIELI